MDNTMKAVLVIAACWTLFATSMPIGVMSQRPPTAEYAKFARWLVFQSEWGTLATVNTSNNKIPFGNVVAFTDGINGTGTPYFYLTTTLDPTGIFATQDPRASFTLSEYALPGSCPGADNAQLPNCSKITLTGELEILTNGTTEDTFARASLLYYFPSFANEFVEEPRNGFHVFKMNIESIFLVNYFAPAVYLDVQEYYNSSSAPPLPSPPSVRRPRVKKIYFPATNAY